jgi:hypothetical protein
MRKNTLKSVNLRKQIINYSLNLEQMWRLWCKALGEKVGKNNKESDKIALIRTILFTTYLITNCFIVAGVIRHWNDETQILIQIESQDYGTQVVR